MTIKNVPADLYESLKQSALGHGRSINGEAIACLRRALQARRVDPERFLARVEALQEGICAPPLTDRILSQAKAEGRP
jgi:plasmid stability protein